MEEKSFLKNSLNEFNDMKSRKVLTDLLNEQIDKNEEIKGENKLLISNQRKLLQLLSNKDIALEELKKLSMNMTGFQGNETNEYSFNFSVLVDPRQKRKKILKKFIMNKYKQLLLNSLYIWKQNSNNLTQQSLKYVIGVKQLNYIFCKRLKQGIQKIQKFGDNNVVLSFIKEEKLIQLGQLIKKKKLLIFQQFLDNLRSLSLENMINLDRYPLQIPNQTHNQYKINNNLNNKKMGILFLVSTIDKQFFQKQKTYGFQALKQHLYAQRFNQQQYDSQNQLNMGLFDKPSKMYKKIQKEKRDLQKKCDFKPILKKRIDLFQKLVINNKKNHSSQMQQFMMNTQQFIKKIEEDYNELDKNHKELKQKTQLYEQTIQEKIEQQESLENQIQENNSQIQNYQKDISKFQKNKDVMDEKFSLQDATIRKFDSVIQQLNKEKQSLNQQIKELNEQIENSQQNIQNEKNYVKLQQENQELKKLISENKNEKIMLFRDIEDKENEIQSLAQKIQVIEQQNQEFIKEIQELHNQRQYNQSQKTYQRGQNGLKVQESQHLQYQDLYNSNYFRQENYVEVEKINDLENKLAKVTQEKQEYKSEIQRHIEQNQKLKQLNQELTQEAIQMNEEKYNYKLMDEKEQLSYENQNLKTEIINMHKNIDETQQSANNQIQYYLQQLEEKDREQEELQSEIKELNYTIANLNREKVNFMREMTLIHEASQKTQKENQNLKSGIEQYQEEIEKYQNQIELYKKVLKKMDGQIKNIENLNTTKQYSSQMLAQQNFSQNNLNKTNLSNEISQNEQSNQESKQNNIYKNNKGQQNSNQNDIYEKLNQVRQQFEGKLRQKNIYSQQQQMQQQQKLQDQQYNDDDEEYTNE
ncbi:hypothetical protein PPERSA_11374 [Pseudocohnilembus persalinus]|uniref:Uncharacterized protein n=1 Tax=Pseudocohnilembus persalinus TaxID=266149 RepID=A0A0V0QQD9_PSEPJ|nr:hypothetical protein PPERSA_11374 [Pseudocohnilembus persalinus]|eukprot:KRX04250.1 hypothetical protein PPERSA_11374 [Pseudocohnilembus persalinus]